MNNPSIKTLSAVTDCPEQLRAIITGAADPEQYAPVADWIRQCYHRPSDNELIMCAANVLINGHGIEALRCDGYHGSYHAEIHATYVNQGDTYEPTLILDHRGRFIVSSWGDYVESIERRAGGCRFQ